ncbi:unnamed protein product, partial [Durusdinium trenchii]
QPAPAAPAQRQRLQQPSEDDGSEEQKREVAATRMQLLYRMRRSPTKRETDTDPETRR